MVSQQLIIQCDVCSVTVIYISNKSQYLKNNKQYGKTIDGVPLSLISRVLSNKTNLIFISYTL